jgi:altronate dehydratase small subunit
MIMKTAYKTVMMKPVDKVAVALMKIPAGATIKVVCENCEFTVTLKEEIEFGHKFAVQKIQRGADILKYGEVIGRATGDIEAGEHVHIHNLEGTRGRGDKTNV